MSVLTGMERKVGPHGFVHGWHYVGIPGTGDHVHHPSHGKGVVTAVTDKHVSVRFGSGAERTFEHSAPKAGQATGFVKRGEHDAGAGAAPKLSPSAGYAGAARSLAADVRKSPVRSTLVGGRHYDTREMAGSKLDEAAAHFDAGRNSEALDKIGAARNVLADRASEGRSAVNGDAGRLKLADRNTDPTRETAVAFHGESSAHNDRAAALHRAASATTGASSRDRTMAVEHAKSVRAADLREGSGKLPPLAIVRSERQADGSHHTEAVDHEGRDYTVRLGTDRNVTVTHEGQSLTEPAGGNATQKARELAGKLTAAPVKPARPAEPDLPEPASDIHARRANDIAASLRSDLPDDAHSRGAAAALWSAAGHMKAGRHDDAVNQLRAAEIHLGRAGEMSAQADRLQRNVAKLRADHTAATGARGKAGEAREVGGKIPAPKEAPAKAEAGSPDGFWATEQPKPEPAPPAPQPKFDQGAMFAEPDKLGTAPMFGDKWGTSGVTEPGAGLSAPADTRLKDASGRPQIPGAWAHLTRVEAGTPGKVDSRTAFAISDALEKLHSEGSLNDAEHAHLLAAKDAFGTGDHGNATDHLAQVVNSLGLRNGDRKVSDWVGNLYRHADGKRENRRIVSYRMNRDRLTRTVTQPPARIARGQEDTRPVVSAGGRTLTSNRGEVNEHLDNASRALAAGDEAAAASHLAAASFTEPSQPGSDEYHISDRARRQSDILAGRSELPRTPGASHVVAEGTHQGVGWKATERRDELGNGLDRTYTLTHGSHVSEVPAHFGPHSAIEKFLGTPQAAPAVSSHAATARGIAGNVRLESGLTRGQKDEAETRLYAAAKHLDAGNHEDAAAELDAVSHAAGLRGGGVIKGSTAAQARDLRDKIRAGNPGSTAAPAKEPAKPVKWEDTGVSYTGNNSFASMNGHRLGVDYQASGGPFRASVNAQHIGTAGRLEDAKRIAEDHARSLPAAPARKPHEPTLNEKFSSEMGDLIPKLGKAADENDDDFHWNQHDSALAARRHIDDGETPQAAAELAKAGFAGEHGVQIRDLHTRIQMARAHGPEAVQAADTPWLGSLVNGDNAEYRRVGGHTVSITPGYGGNGYEAHHDGTLIGRHEDLGKLRRSADIRTANAAKRQQKHYPLADEVKELTTAIISTSGRENQVRGHLAAATTAIEGGDTKTAYGALDLARRHALGEFGVNPLRPVLLDSGQEAAKVIVRLRDTIRRTG